MFGYIYIYIYSINMKYVAYVGLENVNSLLIRNFSQWLTLSRREMRIFGGRSGGIRTLVFWRASQRTTSNVADSRTNWIASTWPILRATCNADSRCGVYRRNVIQRVASLVWTGQRTDTRKHTNPRQFIRRTLGHNFSSWVMSRIIGRQVE